MSGLSTFLSVVTAVIMLGSAAYDFTSPPAVVDLVARLGRYPGFERTLGLVKALGAIGLLVGLAIGPIGVLAALGLCAYFVLAVRAHSRLGDPGNATLPAAGLFILCAVTLIANLLG